MSNNNGGQAFPRAGFSGPGGYGRPENGMSLRDYFAAKAMLGIISLGGDYSYTKEDMESGTPADAIARYSYQVADAMLKEREK